MNADHDGPLCSDQAACSVCQLWLMPGETREAFKARIGALFRASPERRPSVAAKWAEATCSVCGRTFQAVRATVCSSACDSTRRRAKKRAARLAS